MKLDFVERKTPNLQRIGTLLSESASRNHWANRGPLYLRLEQMLAAHAGVDGQHRLIPVANGGVALEAMARLFAKRAGRPLRWIASAYSFRNLGRGYFHDAIFVDCDRRGLLDLEICDALDPESFDGLIVTNPFGLCQDFTAYEVFSRRLGKSLLIDNASGLHCRIPALPWQAFSLHHTKPYGVGEGGLALVPIDEADALYGLVDYASENSGSPHWLGNGKISDISCAFHIDRLERASEWVRRYLDQQERVLLLAGQLGFFPLSTPQPGFPMTSMPLIAPGQVSEERIHGSRHLTLAKYYKPLRDLPTVTALYERLVNLPCHPDVAALTDSEIVEELTSLMSTSPVRSAGSKLRPGLRRERFLDQADFPATEG